MSKENKGAREFDKVDRALERQVIDWLQWSEFPENITKRSDDSNMAQLTLELIGKRKSAYQVLEQRLAEVEKIIEESHKTISNVLEIQCDIMDHNKSHKCCCADLQFMKNKLSAFKTSLADGSKKWWGRIGYDRELGHISLIDSQADMIEEFKQRLAEVAAISDALPHEPFCAVVDGYGYCDCVKNDLKASLADGGKDD